jgi:hypothetical protein
MLKTEQVKVVQVKVVQVKVEQVKVVQVKVVQGSRRKEKFRSAMSRIQYDDYLRSPVHLSSL